MKPTIEQVRSHVREYYDLTLTELTEVLNTPLHPKTLRDDFASKALQGFLSDHTNQCDYDNESYEDFAKDTAISAYIFADAMLEARK